MFDFLEIEDVLELHEESLQRYGGADGLRDQGSSIPRSPQP
jgi:hypothetical protein